MTRDEHLAWCKRRALDYVEAGDLKDAVASMGSDLSTHPETADTPASKLVEVFPAIVEGDRDAVRRWIEGFR